MGPPQYFSGVLVFMVFRHRISKATLVRLASVHSFLGKATFFFGMDTCLVRLSTCLSA